jgi:hypothetical protein
MSFGQLATLPQELITPRDGWERSGSMVNEDSRELTSKKDSSAEVAEFIRTKGVTRCPTACVLPTQGSVAAADRAALGEYAARRA